jgi:hypothetical protein
MQELVGRLTALDAEATETLKVISYFDALVDGHATTEVLLRGAAILSGCAAGFTAESRTVRVDSSGARSPAPADPSSRWPSRRFGDGGTAWIERDGPAHANDEMILERLAIALAIALERTSPSAALRRALETLIDVDSPVDVRLGAAKRLRLDAASEYRVIATPASTMLPAPSIVVGTVAGPVRVAVCAAGDDIAFERAGIGYRATPSALDQSWASALIALRLTSVHDPVVNADRLGALLILADAADRGRQVAPDAATVGELIATDAGVEELLDAVANAASLRAVAQELGLHHSTVQGKVAALCEALGYDIRSARGRVRLSLALALHRLTTNRFA